MTNSKSQKLSFSTSDILHETTFDKFIVSRTVIFRFYVNHFLRIQSAKAIIFNQYVLCEITDKIILSECQEVPFSSNENLLSTNRMSRDEFVQDFSMRHTLISFTVVYGTSTARSKFWSARSSSLGSILLCLRFKVCLVWT